MFFLNPGCPCCDQKDTPDISPSGGGWECGRCSSVPITYRLTVPSVSAESLTLVYRAIADSGDPTRPAQIQVTKDIPTVSFGGIHTLRRARSDTTDGILRGPDGEVINPFQVPPYIDSNGYFVFPYRRQTQVEGSNRGNTIVRDIRPCGWFGGYTKFDLGVEVTVNGITSIASNYSYPYIHHFWRLRMDYSAYVVRVEGPSVFGYPNTLLGGGVISGNPYIFGRVVYEIPMADFQCHGTTTLIAASSNPTGWPNTVQVDADTILT